MVPSTLFSGRPDTFQPPFCPYRDCEYHYEPPSNRWYQSIGSHQTKAFGSVPRFRCSACGRTFSVQTFSIDYYAKKILPYDRIENLASSSMSLRSLARELVASCGTIQNRLDRLARQGIALHSLLRPRAALHERVCFDGLVSFDRSQYYPSDIGLSISSRSRFILGLSHATTRRSGALSEAQRDRIESVYEGNEFEKKAVERSFSEHLDLFADE